MLDFNFYWDYQTLNMVYIVPKCSAKLKLAVMFLHKEAISNISEIQLIIVTKRIKLINREKRESSNYLNKV